MLVESGAAVGVELVNGEALRARAVASNVNPKLLYQRLLQPAQLPAEFVEAIGRYKCGSGSFRINVALSELPDFRAAPGDRTRSRITPAASSSTPRLPYMDRAWRDAEADGCSTRRSSKC